MTSRRFFAVIAAAVLLLGSSAYQKALEQIQKDTGLAPVQIPNTEGAYLGKTHRGYEVIYTAKAGNVWGRYAARLTAGGIRRETGGLLGVRTGHHQAPGDRAVGSPRGRPFSGGPRQPPSVPVLLRHG